MHPFLFGQRCTYKHSATSANGSEQLMIGRSYTSFPKRSTAADFLTKLRTRSSAKRCPPKRPVRLERRGRTTDAVEASVGMRVSCAVPTPVNNEVVKGRAG